MNIKKSKINVTELEELKNMFICPKCQCKLLFTDTLFKCSNIECNTEYPIFNKIPILINEEDSLFSIEQYKNVKSPNNRKDFLKKMLKKIVPSLGDNVSAKKNFKLLADLMSKREKPKILIVGGGEITVGTDRLFNGNNIIVESDIYIGVRTSIIIDGHHIPFMDETFDLVIFQAVLEHVLDPYKCVKEAHRVLKRDGLVYATTPFMQGVHMKANDFTRFTYLGHRRLFREFKEIEAGVFAGNGVALGWAIRYFVKSFTNNRFIRSALEAAVSYLFFWLKYIDYFTINNKGTYDGASGFYFIGEKSNSILSDRELIKLFKGID